MLVAAWGSLLVAGCLDKGVAADTGGTTEPVVLPANVAASDEITCPSPVEGWERFSEEAVARGVTEPLPDIAEVFGQWVAGRDGYVAVFDLDDDGDLDIAAGGFDGVMDIYLNDGTGHFTWRDDLLVKQVWPGETLEAFAFADLDGDRLPEAVGTGSSRFTLFRNLGGAAFDGGETTYVGGQDPAYAYLTLMLGDLNGDGWLDLFLPSLGEPEHFDVPPEELRADPDVLVLGTADGLVEAGEVAPERGGTRCRTGLLTDREGDGDLDIFLATDLGPESTFWRNDGVDALGMPRLVDDAVEVGAGLFIAAMGIDGADLNADGYQDWCMTDVGVPRCLVSDGAGGWYEGQAAMGLTPADPTGIAHRTVGWSIDFADLDNDGLLDVVQAAGGLEPPGDPEGGDIQPDLVWAGRPDGTFEDVSELTGIHSPDNHIGMATGDLDGDGFLDVVLAGPGQVPEVHMNTCSDAAWIEVDLAAPPPNALGIGAAVKVVAGDLVQTREIHTARGMGQGPARLHFGLGERELVDELWVHWPDGTWSVVEDLPVRRRYTVFHPAVDPAGAPTGVDTGGAEG